MNYQHGSSSLEDPPAHSVEVGPVPPAPKYVPISNHLYNRQRSTGAKCGRFLLLIVAILFFVILFLFLSFLSLFTLLRPKLPMLTVSSIDVFSVQVNPATPTVATNLSVFIDAQNTNQMISVHYRQGGGVVLMYRDVILCTGNVGEFIQPEKNVTRFKVDMSGSNDVGPGIRAALMQSIAGQAKPGEGLGLHLSIKLPMSIRFDNFFDIGQFRVDVECTLDVDSVMPGRKIRVIDSDYQVRVDYFHWS